MTYTILTPENFVKEFEKRIAPYYDDHYHMTADFSKLPHVASGKVFSNKQEACEIINNAQETIGYDVVWRAVGDDESKNVRVYILTKSVEDAIIVQLMLPQ